MAYRDIWKKRRRLHSKAGARELQRKADELLRRNGCDSNGNPSGHATYDDVMQSIVEEEAVCIGRRREMDLLMRDRADEVHEPHERTASGRLKRSINS